MFSHRFHRFSQMVCVCSSVNSVCSVGPPTPPVDLCKSVQSVGGLFWLRGVYPPTKRTCRDVLPQISQILTDVVFLEFCEFCVFCGTSHAPVNLCKSVQSVGGLFSTLLQNRLAEMFSHRIHRTDWQSMFFHRFSQMVRVWSSVNSVYSVDSVGPPTLPVNLCKSVQSVGELFWLRGYGRDAIPSYRATKAEGFTPRSR